jgi:hypothetical protein
LSTTPEVSVIIPTRKRADTLKHSLRTAVAQSFQNIEVIVSNNGGDPETDEVVAACGDRRVRCVTPDAPLSMSHNFEFAMSHARGKWLVLIGDDDGIMPSGIERGLKILEASGASALASHSCQFVWPIGDEKQAGAYLTVPYGSGWEWRSSKDAMRKILKREMGFQDAPTTYTGGMIGADVYRKIQAARGSFYHSQIPDVFSAFATCSVLDRYAFTREPLMIAGLSGHSHGRTSMQLQAHSFQNDGNIPFHPEIPLPENGSFTFSFQALLYESYLQTAYLRGGDVSLTTPEEQAIAIIAWGRAYRNRMTNGDRAAAILERWAETAARHYNLDASSILRRSKDLPLKGKITNFKVALDDFLERFVVDDSLDLPAQDVFEAANIAERIWRERPSRLSSFKRSIQRKIRRGR